MNYSSFDISSELAALKYKDIELMVHSFNGVIRLSFIMLYSWSIYIHPLPMRNFVLVLSMRFSKTQT